MRPGDKIQQRYVLEDLLGRGGMAEVWCARDERLDRRVAIKFLAHELSSDPEFLVRFFSEAQVVARLQHPNIVPVLDFGQVEERPFLVMQYVGGGRLQTWPARRCCPRALWRSCETRRPEPGRRMRPG